MLNDPVTQFHHLHQIARYSCSIASFPGSHAPEHKHWSCAGVESLVFFLTWEAVKDRHEVDATLIMRGRMRLRTEKGTKVAGNLLHISSYWALNIIHTERWSIVGWTTCKTLPFCFGPILITSSLRRKDTRLSLRHIFMFRESLGMRLHVVVTVWLCIHVYTHSHVVLPWQHSIQCSYLPTDTQCLQPLYTNQTADWAAPKWFPPIPQLDCNN